jgi:hypothetical protein
MMKMLMQDENYDIFWLIVVSCFWGSSHNQPPVTRSETIQMNEYLNCGKEKSRRQWK